MSQQCQGLAAVRGGRLRCFALHLMCFPVPWVTQRSFRAPAVNAPGSAWGPAPRRVPVLPPTQALPLPHIGSSALPPLQRYIDQLRLAQSLAQADDEQQQRQVQQQPHAVPSARMQALLAPYTSSTHAPSQQHLQGAEQEPTSASGRPRISHGLAKQPLLPGQQRQQQPLGTQAGRRQGGRASSAAVQLNKEIMAATTTTELLALVRGRGKQMDFFNISSAISRTPKLAGVQGDGHGMATHHPALDGDSRQLAASLAELMCEHITHFDARGLANSAWAFGKLRFMPTPTLPALIASQAIAKIDGFCAQNISNLAWAFVYMHHRDERVLSLLAQKVRCASWAGAVNLAKEAGMLNTRDMPAGLGGSVLARCQSARLIAVLRRSAPRSTSSSRKSWRTCCGPLRRWSTPTLK